MECIQSWIAVIPVGLQFAAQAQFSAQLRLEKGNPIYHNIKKDFNRFGFTLDLQSNDPMGPQRVTDLSHLNEWRNKVAHQFTQPPSGGVPTALTLPIIQVWRSSCSELPISLDGIIYDKLMFMIGIAPW